MIPLPSRHMMITVLVVISSFFLLLWANERYGAYVSERDTRAETEWKAAKENWKNVHIKVVQALASAARADTVIAKEKARGDRALRLADSLRGVRAKTPVPVYTDSLSPVWRGLYYSTLGEAQQLRTVHLADSSALFSALTSRDSLRAVLLQTDTAGTRLLTSGQKLIDVRTCKVLWFIDCPSRRIVAVAGVVIGGLAGAYVERQRSKR